MVLLLLDGLSSTNTMARRVPVARSSLCLTVIFRSSVFLVVDGGCGAGDRGVGVKLSIGLSMFTALLPSHSLIKEERCISPLSVFLHGSLIKPQLFFWGDEDEVDEDDIWVVCCILNQLECSIYV